MQASSGGPNGPTAGVVPLLRPVPVLGQEAGFRCVCVSNTAQWILCLASVEKAEKAIEEALFILEEKGGIIMMVKHRICETPQGHFI